MIKSVAGYVTLALVVVATSGVVHAEDDFPLTGTYTQNAKCKGDGTDPVAIRVKISPEEIVSNVGVCTFLEKKVDGPTISAHVECKLAGGPLIGDLLFTPRPDKTVEFVDRDGNYKAILYPCPN
jgi:hypothetical protein